MTTDKTANNLSETAETRNDANRVYSCTNSNKMCSHAMVKEEIFLKQKISRRLDGQQMGDKNIFCTYAQKN